MSEFKGTPGPWKWESKYFGLRQTTEAGGKWILQPEPWEGMHMAYPSAIRAANARLIAAAPELLSLLKEARSTLEMWKDVAPAVSLCADIDKAIAKATGDRP